MTQVNKSKNENYVGKLFVNVSKAGKTFFKGKIGEQEVIGFLFEGEFVDKASGEVKQYQSISLYKADEAEEVKAVAPKTTKAVGLDMAAKTSKASAFDTIEIE